MKTLLAAAFVISAIAGFGAANAMPLAPVAPTANADIIQVAQGCGPGFHRGPGGGCRPNGGAVVVVRPPVVVRPAPVVVVRPGRVCPPRMAFRAGRCRPF
jgi:hypothetical protein